MPTHEDSLPLGADEAFTVVRKHSEAPPNPPEPGGRGADSGLGENQTHTSVVREPKDLSAKRRAVLIAGAGAMLLAALVWGAEQWTNGESTASTPGSAEGAASASASAPASASLAGRVPREGGRSVDLALGYRDEQRVAFRVRLSASDADKASSTVIEECTPQPMPNRTYRVEAGMVQLTPGSFCMRSSEGTSDERHVHRVPLTAFWMDEKEVTTAQYAACVSGKKCTAAHTGACCNWGKPDRANHPINCVDWSQATAYCAWAGKRLPTEEEWEYAARGMDGRAYPWGNTEPTASLACWNRTRAQGTCEVGSVPADKSPFGLLDMAGNVWEWTSSPYCSSCAAGPKASARVLRGGGWDCGIPSSLRPANRYGLVPSGQFHYLGFRCARSG